MDSKALAALDGIYQRSLDGDVSPSERQLVETAMDKIITRCDDFLADGVRITNEQRAKFRKLRYLASDENRSARLGYDILSHWHLIREIVTEFDRMFCRRKNMVDNTLAAVL